MTETTIALIARILTATDHRSLIVYTGDDEYPLAVSCTCGWQHPLAEDKAGAVKAAAIHVAEARLATHAATEMASLTV